MKEMLENAIFRHRRAVVILFLLLTVFMLWQASHLKIDAGFAKLLPLKHPYMQTYLEYRDAYGGANKIVIAIKTREGDIFTPEFFKVLQEVTDEVFFIPGVDRTRVMSLFTPNVRFTEVVEDGIAGGNVIPADFEPTPEGLGKVRENVLKSNYMGRLVANDFTAAIVVAELLEVNPNTGEKLDVIDVAKQFEGIREKFSADTTGAAFDSTLTVAFGGALADSFVVDSDGQIRALVPVFANTGPVSVTNPAGTGFSAGDLSQASALRRHRTQCADHRAFPA